MKRSREYMIVATLVAGIAAATLATVALMNAGGGFAACSAALPFGWLMALAAVLVLVFAGWLLLRQHRPGGTAGGAASRRSCAECGHDVHEAWRMCPYCGSMMDGSDPSLGTDLTES